MKMMVLAAAGVAALSAQSAQAASCVGNCGTGSPNGVVAASPQGSAYSYVSTANGDGGFRGLNVGGEQNGSLSTTSSFTAVAGDALKFYFNFVTSDGAGFSDYAYVTLNGATDLVLFSARTTPVGDTVPGFGLPPIAAGVTLTPGSTPIIAGAPAWDALGSDSGRCYDIGCGYTGWVRMDYTIQQAGTYTLGFGVVNVIDTAFQTGLAWNGAQINDTPISAIPEPGTWALMILGFGAVGIAARRRGAVATVSA